MLRGEARRLSSVMTGLAVLLVVGLMLAPASGRAAARTQSSSLQPRTAVICLDVTLSVTPKIIPQSLKLIAREFTAQPHPGSGEFIAYVRTIRDNSVDPSNNLLLVDIPGVPRAAHRPSSNLDPAAYQTQVAGYNKRQKAHQQSALAHARAVARKAANEALHLHVSPDTKVGTDLFACPAVAARLMDPYSQNYLLVISDLLPYGRQYAQPQDFHLPNAHVTIVDYCNVNLGVCNQAENKFEQVLKHRGAKQVVVVDSTKLPIMRGIFNP